MENGKLWSGSKFAKCKTLLPDFFSLYGSKCLIVFVLQPKQMANEVRRYRITVTLFYLYNLI